MGMFRCIQVLVLVVVVAIAPLEASASSGARRMSVPAEEVALSQPASFASNWFHTMMPAIGNGTLLDLCLPGTHDSMTYDLSTTVADNANDLNPTIAWLLHELKDFVDIGKFVREFAKTQGLNITQQLDAGIRYIDFRITYTAGPDSSSASTYDWYCVHLVESNQRAVVYLQHIQEWMAAHPEEIVVIAFTRHGSMCDTQYPDTPNSAMQEFFHNVTTIFDGMLFNTAESALNETSVSELVARNHRVVLYVADYSNFTGGGSVYATDSCRICNAINGPGTIDVPAQLVDYEMQFKYDRQQVARNSSDDLFLLRQMGASDPDSNLQYAAYITFIPIDQSKNRATCSADFHIPNMTGWCPMNIQETAHLANYYNQIALEDVITNNWGMPNAIYIDGLGLEGVVGTGMQLGDGYLPKVPAPTSATHTTTAYAYTDTILLWNLRSACAKGSTPMCEKLEAVLVARRAANPYQRWNDPQYGRLADWPQVNVTATRSKAELGSVGPHCPW